jgi:hypothetical protein
MCTAFRYHLIIPSHHSISSFHLIIPSHHSIIPSHHHIIPSSHHPIIPSSSLTGKGELTLLLADASNGSARHTIDENFMVARCRDRGFDLIIEFGKGYNAS